MDKEFSNFFFFKKKETPNWVKINFGDDICTGHFSIGNNIIENNHQGNVGVT